jgi:hypothetical protein
LNSESASNSGSASKSAGKSPSASTLALQPDGFPIPAPLTPLWWSGKVVALGADSTVVSYRPGSDQASLLDLGVKDLQAIAPTP